MAEMLTIKVANRAVGTIGLFLFIGTSAYLVRQFKGFF